MESNNGDDVRKKRDLPKEKEVNRRSCLSEEKLKKPRGASEHSDHDDNEKKNIPTSSRREKLGSSSQRVDTPVCDLETALHRVVGDEESNKEKLSDNVHVTFRWAHGGDASTLAAWYRQSTDGDKKNTTKCQGEEEDPLELWLADSLGDEDTPPAVLAIMANVVIEGETETRSRLAAVALLTLAWEDEKRILRVPWYNIDTSLPESDLLKRRLWLRLSALALMTACESLVVMQKGSTVDPTKSSISTGSTED